MKEKVKALFQPIKIGKTTVKNRIVMSPMDTNLSEIDGALSRKQFAYYRNRARGGVGLIIMEACSVAWPEGKISERQLNVGDDTIAPDLRELVDAVHAYGTKILVQLHHGGFMAVPEYCQGAKSVSASDYNGARALTIEEIRNIEQKFIHAAQVVQNAGFDGIEIHAAHMYLLNQFLCPACNTRTDEYGGSKENQFRIVKNIIQGIRKQCGENFVISVRLGAFDFIPEGGNTVEDGAVYAKMCEEAGADMINVSAGFYSVFETEMTQWDEEGVWVDKSEVIRNAVSIPVAVVGKLRTPSFCAEVIESGKADLVVIGRQLICDPNYPNKILHGKEEEIRPCLNCLEGCIGQFYFSNNTVKCSINPYISYEDLYDENAVPAAGVKKVILVAGGGIAGMQFAIIARKRGHQVILCEKEGKLGGEMILAAMTPFKDDVKKALQWFVEETKRVGTDIRLNTAVDLAYIKRVNPDVVVVAAGSEFAVPPICGSEYAVSGADAISGKYNIGTGKKVAVIGGGVAGCELAHKLILEGNEVFVLEMLPELCPVHEFAHRMCLTEYLNKHANVLTSVTVTKITNQSVEYTDYKKEHRTIPADVVIYCAGQAKNGTELYDESIMAGYETYRIGDHEKASNFRLSTKSAFHLANAI